MSGLAGVFDPKDRPIDRDTFVRMVSHVAYRGPDGVRCWYSPRIAMAFAKFVRTPDGTADQQPLHDLDAGICVTFDGRLDNREELAAQLDLRASDVLPDGVLAAAAYRRWGLECPGRLLGDFSLVVWDEREGRVFVARDILGVRPLFYRKLNDVWWWASDQRALVALKPPAINESYVGEHLSSRITSIDETIYQDICRLPMAHALVMTGTTVRRWRYWRPDPDARLEYRDRRDYEWHFRTLLKDAVRARLRVHGRTALMLSGGIDSSSVAVQIAELRREGHEGASRTKALSLTIPGHPASEGPVILRALERLQLPFDLVPAEAPAGKILRRRCRRLAGLAGVTEFEHDAAAPWRRGRERLLRRADRVRRRRLVRAVVRGASRPAAKWPRHCVGTVARCDGARPDSDPAAAGRSTWPMDGDFPLLPSASCAMCFVEIQSPGGLIANSRGRITWRIVFGGA